MTRGHVPYGYTNGYYAPPSSPAVGGWGQAYAPRATAYQPAYGYGTQYSPGTVYGGYPSAGYVQPADPSAAVVRSLYLQYLGREPDQEGFQYWSGRLAGAGGDIAQITRDFAAAAQNERFGYSPGYNPAFRSYYRFR
jgi:hypothetical protein